ncbi:serine hydrolase domain-containing protein [Cognatiyoonia sp. IB215182]|uniref:serine hydrolase domain-containing protein n=1 Tax=Cognatiyoonia sp. IB215182 TaxID=3097353 RepID=UPI002A148A09|nr:serine hydrolase domain-containing protein [Cognatiyoonia sp. IB215182]MDX8351999.1 serine hydrolase domain-containing protein [Cognatiyoonia sp. IB215182]
MKAPLLGAALAALATPALADTPAHEALETVMRAHHPVIVAAQDGAGAVTVESGVDIKAHDADEIVDLGSIAKTVTAIATLHLIEEPGLSVQSTLAALLPDVPDDKANITLHQLLTHTSGIVESTGDDNEPLTRAAFLERVLATPLDNTPGATYAYSNAGYSLLAAVIEIRSGMTYEDYLIENVIPEGSTPIGYGRAYDEDRAITSHRTWLTGFKRRHVAEASWGGPAPGWNLIGNGGLVTTAEGFLSFWAAFLNADIVSEHYVAAAMAPHVDEGDGMLFSGYGLVVEKLENGSVMFWHDGGNDIFSAEWRHLADTGQTYFTAGTGSAAFDAMESILAATSF